MFLDASLLQLASPIPVLLLQVVSFNEGLVLSLLPEDALHGLLVGVAVLRELALGRVPEVGEAHLGLGDVFGQDIVYVVVLKLLLIFDLLLPAILQNQLQLLLLLGRQLVRVLEKLHQLLLCELDHAVGRLVVGVFFVLGLQFGGVIVLAGLVLVHDFALAGALLHAGAHHVLALTLFLLRGNLVDDLLLVLEHSLLGGRVLLSVGFLGLRVAALECGEEVVHQNALARLDFAPFLPPVLFLVVRARSALFGRLPAAGVDWVHIASAETTRPDAIDLRAHFRFAFF